MRKLVYYVACTVDRYIAREDGSFDCFLSEGDHLADLFTEFPETLPVHLREALGVTAENRWFDTVLMGRNTYEVGLPFGVTSPYSHMRQYVFSRSMKESLDNGVELVSGDPVALVKDLKQEDGLDIWLCGGGALAGTLYSEIDELILKVNPVVIGSGIPLFAGAVAEPAPVELVSSRIYDNGFMRVHYRKR
jgi:dihydrofolate reductase